MGTAIGHVIDIYDSCCLDGIRIVEARYEQSRRSPSES
jgi:hypothetical protein